MGAPAAAPAAAGLRAGALRALVLLSLALPVLGAYGSGKKSKFLAAYPMIFKFFLFWWCITVFVVMGFYIADYLMCKKFGSAKVAFSVEHTFKGGPRGGREAFWAQLADPTKWSPRHPVLQSADVRMVRCTAVEEAATNGKADDSKDAADGDAAKDVAQNEAEQAEPAEPAPSTRLQPVELRPLEEGLGFILRHKGLGGPREGSFFCTRKCEKLEQPAEGPWRLVMRTVEVGTGYPYDPDSEETDVEMYPPAEDGSVRCVITGFALSKSRIFRWWNSLDSNGRLGATSMLEAIEEEVLSPKKKD